MPFAIPRGTPGATDALGLRAGFSNFSDADQKALGWTPRGFQESVRDSLQCLVDRKLV